MYAAVQSSPTPQHAQRTVSTCWSEPTAALAAAVAALEATTSGRGLLATAVELSVAGQIHHLRTIVVQLLVPAASSCVCAST